MTIGKYNGWEVIEVRMDELTDADFEPSTRLHDDASMRKLKASIEERGILVPLLITSDKTIIDGHRRKYCGLKVGLEWAPAIVLNGEIADLFREVNDTRKNVTGAQWMEGYTLGGEVPQRVLSKIEGLKTIVGQEGIERLVSLGVSPTLYNLIRRTAKYCGKPDDIIFQARLIHWVTEYHQALHLTRALRDFVPPEVIITAVEEGRELVAKWEVG